MILSAANMLSLRQSMPTKAQLRFWDRWIVPISRVLDKLLLYSVGKTIIAVWAKAKVVKAFDGKLTSSKSSRSGNGLV